MGKLSADGKEYSEIYEVKSYDTNWHQELKASSMLKFFQDVSSCHLGCFGMSYNELLNDNVVFLVTALSLRILKPAMLRDKIVVTTWHCGIKGVRFIRNTVIESENGERLCECSADWVLTDPVAHRLKKPRDFSKIMSVPPNNEKALASDSRTMIHCPESMDFIGEREIKYSDIDYNHHLNNTVYADIITDCLGSELMEKGLCEMKIVYAGEATFGDKISLFRSGTDEGSIIIKGTHSAGRCFEAEVKLR